VKGHNDIERKENREWERTDRKKERGIMRKDGERERERGRMRKDR